MYVVGEAEVNERRNLGGEAKVMGGGKKKQARAVYE
jgi:hypothetical protein